WVASDNREVSGVDSRSFGPVPVGELLPRVERLDPIVFGEAVELLASEDTALRRLVDEHGTPELWGRPPGFATLVLLILEQQVSLESGAAMFRRVSTDRKSTRLNSSHVKISYAVFCLKKKITNPVSVSTSGTHIPMHVFVIATPSTASKSKFIEPLVSSSNMCQRRLISTTLTAHSTTI